MDKLKPRFSVITCAYNSEKYIQQCLDSVKQQNFKDYEHIIVYGTSTDKTAEIIAKYKGGSQKIKVIEIEVKGISDAMNVGIDTASGEYIHFLHSDDWYQDSNALSYISGLIDSTHKQVLIGPKTLQYGNTIFNLRILKHFSSKQILFLQKLGNFVPHGSLFMSKSLFDQYGKFDKTRKISMDYDLWFRVLKEDNFLIYDKPTVVYRRHRDSTSFKFDNLYNMLVEDLEIKRKYRKSKLA